MYKKVLNIFALMTLVIAAALGCNFLLPAKQGEAHAADKTAAYFLEYTFPTKEEMHYAHGDQITVFIYEITDFWSTHPGSPGDTEYDAIDAKRLEALLKEQQWKDKRADIVAEVQALVNLYNEWYAGDILKVALTEAVRAELEVMQSIIDSLNKENKETFTAQKNVLGEVLYGTYHRAVPVIEADLAVLNHIKNTKIFIASEMTAFALWYADLKPISETKAEDAEDLKMIKQRIITLLSMESEYYAYLTKTGADSDLYVLNNYLWHANKRLDAVPKDDSWKKALLILVIVIIVLVFAVFVYHLIWRNKGKYAYNKKITPENFNPKLKRGKMSDRLYFTQEAAERAKTKKGK